MAYSEPMLLKIASQFDLEGSVSEIRPLGDGFINDTFVVKTAGDAPDYILQRKIRFKNTIHTI